MTSFVAMAALGGLLLASPLADPSPFDGTWKGDVSTATLPTKPDVQALKGGVYSCSTCIPAVTVKADGRFHDVAGHSYFDAMKVTVLNPRALAYEYRRAGKVVSTSTDTVSADGQTLASKFHSTNNGSGTPIDGGSTASRVGPAAKGEHAVSGSWRTASVEKPTDAALYLTLKDADGKLALSTRTGEAYVAAFGGPFVAMTGDPGKTMVSVKKLPDGSIEETDMRDGKVVTKYLMTVQPDGRSMKMAVTDTRQQTTTTFVAYKQ